MRILSACLILALFVAAGCQDTSNSAAPDSQTELIETSVEGKSGDTDKVSSERSTGAESDEQEEEYDLTKIQRTDKEWRKRLSREQYRVTREHATERARTGRFWNHKAEGVYTCVCCDLPLFDSKTKFVSGTGWPSFYEPINRKHVGTQADNSLFMRRTEVHCKRCDAHLGHVFDDGPRPTGLRYCINSASLDFKKASEAKKSSK